MKMSYVLVAAFFIVITMLISVSISMNPFVKTDPAVLAQRQKDADEAAALKAKQEKHKADVKLMQEELCSGMKFTAMMDCLQ